MPGDIFIRLLTLTILPLIAANVIVVTSNLDPKQNGKMSLVAFVFIIASNVVAALMGLITCLILKPGNFKPESLLMPNQTISSEIPPKTSDIFADLLYNLFPDNIVGVSLFQSRTAYEVASQSITGNKSTIFKRKITNVSSINMLGLLFCSFTFGIAAGKAGTQGKLFLDFFRSVSAVVLRIMNVFLMFTPIGVCFMIAGPIAAVDNLTGTFSQLGLFAGTVVLGLAGHLVVMFTGYALLTRANPFRLLPYCLRTWLIAFTTLSPVVAIPEMYKASDRFGINPHLSRFVVPLSAALKGDGSAVFISASSLFIAQLSEFEITAGTVIIIWLLSASAVLAIPNIPSSSIVILVTILTSLGIPINYVGLLFAMEWLLDRLRTTNLAILHLYCVAFTQYLCIGNPGPQVTTMELSMKEEIDTVVVSKGSQINVDGDGQKMGSSVSALLNGDASTASLDV